MDYIIYFAITIGILVFIHELGHFLAAKMTGMRADVFAIGFGKRLFGYNKKTGFTFGDLPKDFDGEGHTDYRLSLLPLGGYVKIAGMVDESMDADFANSEPKPYEFRSKSFLQKTFVITAGVAMNLLLAILIFWGRNYLEGDTVLLTTTVGYVRPESPADSLGFKTGDEIEFVNGVAVNNWEQLRNEFYVSNLGDDLNIKFLRNGLEQNVFIKRKSIPNIEKQGELLTPEGYKPMVSDVMEGSPAQAAGMLSGDVVLSLNGEPMNGSAEFIEIVSNSKETELHAKILRGTDTLALAVTPGSDGKVGIAIGDIFEGKTEKISFGLFKSFAVAGEQMVDLTVLTFKGISKVVSGQIEVENAVAGPIRIAKFAAKSAEIGLEGFLYFLAVLSLSLALINIMPFPVLDGGHLIMIIIETIIRKEIPVKIKVAINNTGFVLLLILMAFIIYSDILAL